jgi:hypothetical protein
VTACRLTLEGAPAADAPLERVQAALDALGAALVGQRYAFVDRAALDGARAAAAGQGQSAVHDDVLAWLEGEMAD